MTKHKGQVGQPGHAGEFAKKVGKQALTDARLNDVHPVVRSRSTKFRDERDAIRQEIAARQTLLHDLDKLLVAQRLAEELGPNMVKFTISTDETYGEFAEYRLGDASIQTSVNGPFEPCPEAIHIINDNLTWESRIKFAHDYKPETIISDDAEILIDTVTGEWTRYE